MGTITMECQAAIKVRRLYFLKDVAEDTYCYPRHTNVDGIIAHEVVKLREHSQFAFHLSCEANVFVEENFRARVLIAKIMSMHIQLVLGLKRRGVALN